jgi:hypothetical protein
MTSTAERDDTSRLFRDAVAVCLAMTVFAAAVWPRSYGAAGGVLAGGLLMGGSAWAIRGAVDGLLSGAGGRTSSWVLVKFFTRHAILAVAAYAIMARLHLDPVGMLAGVSSLALAAAVEAIRRLQRVS